MAAATSVVVLDRGNNTTCTINLHGVCMRACVRARVSVGVRLRARARVCVCVCVACRGRARARALARMQAGMTVDLSSWGGIARESHRIE